MSRIRYSDEATGEVFESGGRDGKLKRPLVEDVVSGRVSRSVGAARNNSATIIKEPEMDKALAEELAATKAENERLKRLLSEANTKVLGGSASSKGEVEPWVKLGMTRRTYFRKKKEGKL
jgi:hypothetical protein